MTVERRIGIQLPAQYDTAKAANLMVFQDGHAYVTTNGGYRVPVVFDNLIARKEMPVTIVLGHIGPFTNICGGYAWRTLFDGASGGLGPV